MWEVSHTQHPHKNHNPSFQRGLFNAYLKLNKPLSELLQNG